MAYIDYESEIENQIETQLESGGNTVFEINRYYDSTSPNELLDYILSKVKQKPAVFLRCEGFNSDELSTLGEITNATYTVSIIAVSPNLGKVRQIKGERRNVNLVIQNLLSRLVGFDLDLTDQPTQPLVIKSVKDLFTNEHCDARMITMEVQGVVIDLDNDGLETILTL